jgi:hypothetical protein
MRMNFALTYIGPILHSSILESVGAKFCEFCVDSRGFTYAFISTLKQKRATAIEGSITSWNDEQPSDATKIRLHPFPGEDNVVTFTKTAGHTKNDHFIVKTIKEQRLKSKEESTYRFWSPEDSFASHAQPSKKRALERELEIDMAGPSSYTRSGRGRRDVGDGGAGGGDVYNTFEAANAALRAVFGLSVDSAALAAPGSPVDSAALAAPGSPVDSAALAAHWPPLDVDALAAPGSPVDFATQSDDEEPPPLARIISCDVVDQNSPEIIRAKDEVIKSKDEVIESKDEVIRAKDQVIAEKQIVIDALLRVLNR